ncbi:MAG: VRR-NUC domain-containing protein, partial [Pseudomonadota bacterium]
WLGSRTQAPAARLARGILLLSRDARRLLARLLNRKRGPLRTETLNYPELSNAGAALRELEAAGLLERQPPLCGSRLLALLRRDELMALFAHELDGLQRLRKPDLLRSVLERCPDTVIHERLRTQLQWVVLMQDEHFQLLALLYFGDQHGSLTQFITEALGIVSYPTVTLSPPRALPLPGGHDTGTTAGDPAAAALRSLQALWIQCDLSHRMSTALSGCRTALPADRQRCIRTAWRLARVLLPVRPEPLLDGRRRRALLRLGHAFERTQAWWPALRCFLASSQPPAAERRLRVLWHLKQQDAARAVARELLTPGQPALDRDFGASLLRHGIRRRHGRGDEIRVSLLEMPYSRPIEQQALDLLLPMPAVEQAAAAGRTKGSAALQQQPCGWHCENLFPLGLAGLIYWPVLYAAIPGAFTRRFQSTPHGLGEPAFLRERQPVLDALERQWLQGTIPTADAGETLTAHILGQHAANAGTQNPLVNWQFWTAERLGALLSRVDPLLLLPLARFTLFNLADFRTGFPDLVICSAAGSLCCVEVKGPNDSLQLMQRQWLRVLKTLGIEAYVLKIEADGRS